MPILISQNILKRIDEEIIDCVDSFYVISAFCKKTLLAHFDEILQGRNLKKRLIVRMRPDDILKGATDLDLYLYCKDNGWDMSFRLDLHAKTYVFDDVRCIVGSANATGSGLSVGGVGNYEMATTCKLEVDDCNAIKGLFASATQMTDSIYDLMKDTIESSKKTDFESVTWPEDIIKLQRPDFSVLFSEDFPQTMSPFGENNDELGFIYSSDFMSKEEIRQSFEESKCYLWIKEELEKKENHEIYFGELSSVLHNILLDDPKPYRKEVKVLLANLLSWIEQLECKDIIIDRPNYSQRIRLRKMGT